MRAGDVNLIPKSAIVAQGLSAQMDQQDMVSFQHAAVNLQASFSLTLGQTSRVPQSSIGSQIIPSEMYQPNVMYLSTSMNEIISRGEASTEGRVVVPPSFIQQL